MIGGAGQMTQRVRTLVFKADDLSSISANMFGRKDQL